MRQGRNKTTRTTRSGATATVDEEQEANGGDRGAEEGRRTKRGGGESCKAEGVECDSEPVCISTQSAAAAASYDNDGDNDDCNEDCIVGGGGAAHVIAA